MTSLHFWVLLYLERIHHDYYTFLFDYGLTIRLPVAFCAVCALAGQVVLT